MQGGADKKHTPPTERGPGRRPGWGPVESATGRPAREDTHQSARGPRPRPAACPPPSRLLSAVPRRERRRTVAAACASLPRVAAAAAGRGGSQPNSVGNGANKPPRQWLPFHWRMCPTARNGHTVRSHQGACGGATRERELPTYLLHLAAWRRRWGAGGHPPGGLCFLPRVVGSQLRFLLGPREPTDGQAGLAAFERSPCGGCPGALAFPPQI